jgi:predicted phosphodiesterase
VAGLKSGVGFSGMKLAVLSDIHGNWPALEAVAADIDAWQPDRVLVNGDVVNDGPSNAACWRYIARRRAEDNWQAVRGNHEEYVAEWRDPATPREGAAFDLIRLSRWTYEQLNGEVDELAGLPERWNWSASDGSTLVAMHGTLLGNRAGIYPFTSDTDVWRRIVPEAVFITSHTHVAHIRTLNDTKVVNTGSVGIPGDGDGRAAYARLTWTRNQGWRAAIRRVAYDRTAAEQAYFSSGFMAEAGPEAVLSLLQFRMSRDVRTRWSTTYRRATLEGSISHADSVSRFLDQDEFRSFLPDVGGYPLTHN